MCRVWAGIGGEDEQPGWGAGLPQPGREQEIVIRDIFPKGGGARPPVTLKRIFTL